MAAWTSLSTTPASSSAERKRSRPCASVTLYLPRLTGDPEESSEDTDADRARIGPRNGPEMVLVVEDDETVRAYTTAALRELGYRVLEAPNASAALEIMDRQPELHRLFTDVGLPAR